MLNIITPSIRFDNLVQIQDSISLSLNKARSNWDNIRWIVVLDSDIDVNTNIDKAEIYYLKTNNNNGLSGNPQRNYGLDLVDDGYVYFLDDDNILHPDYLEYFFWFENNYVGSAFITPQVWKNGVVRLLPKSNNIAVGGIDTAQFTLPKNLIGDIKWDIFNYCADGVFAEEVYNKHKDKFIFVPKPLCYYNYLRD